MSFMWEKMGTFKTPAEADAWCRRQGIAVTDSKLVPRDDGYELEVRAQEVDDDDRQQRPRW